MKQSKLVFISEQNGRLFAKFVDRLPGEEHSKVNKELFDENLIDEIGLPNGQYFKMEEHATIEAIEKLGIKVILE